MATRKHPSAFCGGAVMLSLLTGVSAAAQTVDPVAIKLTPPSGMVSAVRKSVNRVTKNSKSASLPNSLAKTLERDPNAVYIRKGDGNGKRLWELHWSAPDKVSLNDTAFTVDEETRKVVGFSDYGATDAARADFAAGKPVTTTEVQAKARLDEMMHAVEVYPGDWRDEPAVLRQYGSHNGKEGQFYWEVTKRKLVAGYSVGRGFSFAIVDAYGGRITNFVYRDDAVLVPPTRPIFTAAQLEPLAVEAFEEYAAPILKPGDSHIPEHSPKRPHWRSLTDDSPLCRLQYVFSFYLSFVDDPTFEARHEKDPNDAYWYGRGARTIWVEMDAETGEILSAATPSGGGGAGLTYNGCSAHVGMLYTMLQVKPADALALAVIGSFPLKIGAIPDPKDKSVVRLHRAIGGKTFSFAFAPTAKRLFWQIGGGKIPAGWAGVSLSDERAANLSRLLKKTPKVAVKTAPTAKTKDKVGASASCASPSPPI